MDSIVSVFHQYVSGTANGSKDRRVRNPDENQ